MAPEDLFRKHLKNWRAIHRERCAEAIGTIAGLPGVIGIILGGSAGRGQVWPLSDIDLIYISAHDAATDLPEQVDALGLEITRNWGLHTWATHVDAGRLYFKAAEVDVLLDGSRSLGGMMADERIFHAADKAHLGQPVHASNDCDTRALVQLLDKSRFSTTAVSARQSQRIRRANDLVDQALYHLDAANLKAAHIAIEALMRLRVPFLMEAWGRGDRSFGRVFTHFCTLARQKNKEHLAHELIDALSLHPDAVETRYAQASAAVIERHATSYPARLAIGENIDATDDQRDALFAYSWYALRAGATAAWLGNEALSTAQLTEKLAAARALWHDADALEKDAISQV